MQRIILITDIFITKADIKRVVSQQGTFLSLEEGFADPISRPR